MARPAAIDVLPLYREAQTIRSVNENDWKLAAAYCLPSHYSAWSTTGIASYNANSAARRVMFDTTGARSLPKYASVLERMATPSGQKWHGLTASDPSLRKQHRVRAYFDLLRDTLFKYRYHPRAGFRIATGEMYLSMGAYGNGPIYIGQRKAGPLSPQPGMTYIACPLRDLFFLTDDEGNITAVFRRFWLNARQFKLKWPDAPTPEKFQAAGGKPTSETTFLEFFHYVHPRTDHDPRALDARRHPFTSSYVCVEEQMYIGDEAGMASMPYLIPRTMTVSGNPYGISPAVTVLAALGGASAVKKTYIKQGQKAVDPVLLAYDDGVLNGDVDLRPGAVNPGGLDKQGRKLIQALDTGDFRVAEVLLQDERKDIEDSFFVTLFQILTETPEMTATEVMERVAEKASLLSPTMGRLQSEFLGPGIEREIDVLVELGVMPPPPPELVEAQGEYEIVYTSPLAKGEYAEEVSGFMRSVEMSLNIANATQDMSHLDHFDFDTAIPEISDYMAVPVRWMMDPKKKEAKRDERSSQMEQAQLLQNAPALASAAKTAVEMGQPKK